MTTVVTRLLCLVLLGGVAVAAPAPAAAAAPLELTFPVAGAVRFEDDYLEPRDGGTRLHLATDVYGAKLQRLHAVAGGTVCGRSSGVVGGAQLQVCGDDGRRYTYTHLNTDSPGTDDGAAVGLTYGPGVNAGARVERGAFLGWIGDSGNAEDDGAQLHLAIRDIDGSRMNPYPALAAAVERGDVPDAPVVAGRVFGATRLETAAAVAAAFGSASLVVVAPAAAHAPALLASAFGAPVLLADASGLPGAAREQVRRLRPARALVVSAVPASVDAALLADGVGSVQHLDAADEPALSAAVALEVERTLGSVDEVLLCAADAWPDALSGAALAAATGRPILLVRGDVVAPPVADALAALGPARIRVLGGTAVVSQAAAASAAEAAGGAVIVRTSGAERYATSAAVADLAADPSTVWVATGRSFPDALAAGPAAGLSGAPLLLVDGALPPGALGDAGTAATRWLALTAPGGATIAGGPAAVSPTAAAQLDAVLSLP